MHARAHAAYLPLTGVSLMEGAAFTTPHWLVSDGGSGLGLMAIPAAKVGALLLLGTTYFTSRTISQHLAPDGARPAAHVMCPLLPQEAAACMHGGNERAALDRSARMWQQAAHLDDGGDADEGGRGVDVDGGEGQAVGANVDERGVHGDQLGLHLDAQGIHLDEAGRHLRTAAGGTAR